MFLFRNLCARIYLCNCRIGLFMFLIPLILMERICTSNSFVIYDLIYEKTISYVSSRLAILKILHDTVIPTTFSHANISDLSGDRSKKIFSVIHINDVLLLNKINANPTPPSRILFYYERNRCSFDSVQFSETALFSSWLFCYTKFAPCIFTLKFNFGWIWVKKVKSRWVLVVESAPRWVPTSIGPAGKFMFMNWEICHKRYGQRGWIWNSVNNFSCKRILACVHFILFLCLFVCGLTLGCVQIIIIILAMIMIISHDHPTVEQRLRSLTSFHWSLFKNFNQFF